MDKEIGAQELVYATITDFIPQKASISITFNHLSGKAADHCYSKDKDKYTHCYHDLEVGQHYIIVTQHTGKKRWVWRKAMIVSKKEMEAFRDIAGLCPSFEQMEEAMEWLRNKRNPPLPQQIADLLVF